MPWYFSSMACPFDSLVFQTKSWFQYILGFPGAWALEQKKWIQAIGWNPHFQKLQGCHLCLSQKDNILEVEVKDKVENK